MKFPARRQEGSGCGETRDGLESVHGRRQATLDRERFQYPDPRVQRKMEVLWLVSQGLNRTDAARLAGVSTKTVRRYVKRYKRGGIEALQKSQYRGRESTLNEHVETLNEYFGKNPPATVKQAQAAIEKLTGIRREYSQVRAFLHRLGCGVARWGRFRACR